MERLTELKYDITKLDSRIKNMHEYIEKMAFDDKAEVEFLASTVSYLKELREYKQLEEQGLLLRLPCKVGDTVWVITSPFNVFEGIEYDKNLRDECYEAFISSVTFYKNSVQYRINAKVTNHFVGAYYNEQNFGKTVFLTKAEAEQKLKEMESD